MEYISTRGFGPVSFERTLLDGLAPDGGLYVPMHYPTFTRQKLEEMSFLSYEAIAEEVMAPFIGDAIPRDIFHKMIRDAYRHFEDDDVTPLNQLSDDVWVMELYHGPTLAFKDIALQLLGRMFDYVLKKQAMKACVIGATSGDTGPAALAGLVEQENVTTFMLFPKNRISSVQQRQMTTLNHPRVFPIAIEGTFDDCQDIVKALFHDLDFKDEVNATAVNSMSWARLLPQMVYYFFAWSRIRSFHEEKRLSFSVPTGNFGDIYAGYLAMQCGLPIERLLIANNQNDILTRFVHEADYSLKGVKPSRSPSIDIQVASNFERFLYDVYGKMPERTRAALQELRETGKLHDISPTEMDDVRSVFEAHAVSEVETLMMISKMDVERQLLLDPHTAVAMVAAEAKPALRPMVVLSTAHPAKFPSAVLEATGSTAALPAHLEEIMTAEEEYAILPADSEAVKAYILEKREQNKR